MSDLFSRTVCVSKSCGWNAFTKDVGCSSGNDSCLMAEFLTANESDFHTAELKEATDEIRKIIAGIRKERGRKLALLSTPFGVLLAWVRHDIKIPAGAITKESSP